ARRGGLPPLDGPHGVVELAQGEALRSEGRPRDKQAVLGPADELASTGASALCSGLGLRSICHMANIGRFAAAIKTRVAKLYLLRDSPAPSPCSSALPPKNLSPSFPPPP